MIRAASLIYAVIIALILSIFTASIVLSQYYKTIESETDVLESKLRLNATSAINYFLASDSYQSPSATSLSLYDGIADSVLVAIEKWGILDVIKATAISGNKSFTQAALIGDLIDRKNSPALYLADNNSPLALCGKTRIIGDCFLPKSGVKRAYIEGQNFMGINLIDGKISVSNSSLPSIDKPFLENMNRMFNYATTIGDSILTYPTVTSSYGDFENKNQIIFSEGSISLGSNNYEGKILIISKKEIDVSSQCILKDVILVAPKVTVGDNFVGNIQIFASDSIYIGKSTTLKYPSVVSTINSNGEDKHPQIIIDDNATISGLILMNTGYDPIKKRTNLSIGNGSLVIGTVYCNGILGMKGNVIGSVYCESIVLKTPSAIFQ